MRNTARILLLAVCLVFSGRMFAGTSDSIFLLNDVKVPLSSRQEKALGLLQAWEVTAPHFVMQYRLNAEEDLAKLQQSLNTLITRADDQTSSVSVGSVEDHLLVHSIARAGMVNSLDFSVERLRHFYALNAERYSCDPRASVSELLIPHSYVNSAGTTAILDAIDQRLHKESFPRVAYHINDQLGISGTGYRGEVSKSQVGEERFSFFNHTVKHGREVGGSGDKVGGPYQVPEGWLYVQVHSLISDSASCFDAQVSDVAQDYGREWLKKIYADTLATATAELKPDFRPYTTGTALSSYAFIVGGHQVSFVQARATLSYLMGDESDPRFWLSIQRQALEIELIYHGEIGRKIRNTLEYQAHCKLLAFLSAKQTELVNRGKNEMTTDAVALWYGQNQKKYERIASVSFDVFSCETTGGVMSALDTSKCSAALSQLALSSLPVSDRGNFDLNGTTISHNSITSASFQLQSREVQVALQDLKPGEWSRVFTEHGRPKVIYLRAMDRLVPEFDKVREQAAEDYRMDFITRFWSELVAN